MAKKKRTVVANAAAANAIAEAPDDGVVAVAEETTKRLDGVQRFNEAQAVRRAAASLDRTTAYAVAYIVQNDYDELGDLTREILDRIDIEVPVETDSVDMCKYVDEIAAVLPEALEATLSS
jgi:hypothetical protein